jgi:hypothetical protein
VHGTSYDYRDGRLARVTDRTGTCHAQLTWNTATDRLVRLVVDGVTVDGAITRHPLLGDAHTIGDTAMTALDWVRPTEIPAIAEPARLPPGAGGAVLNLIALLAQRAGIAALRYSGPYPTAALWRSLARSFRATGDEAAFTADALGRALRVARDPIAIDFAPAPHERLAVPGGFVELRDGIERAVIAGISFEPGDSPARFTADRHCEIWFGDAPYARLATLAADGALLEGPHAIPRCTSPVIGRAFPDALRIALAELVAEAVPAPLADDARLLCAAGPLIWDDLGARAARELPETCDAGDDRHQGGFAVHAALWDRIAPLGLGRLALALAEALAPVVAAAVVRRASRQAARGT